MINKRHVQKTKSSYWRHNRESIEMRAYIAQQAELAKPRHKVGRAEPTPKQTCYKKRTRAWPQAIIKARGPSSSMRVGATLYRKKTKTKQYTHIESGSPCLFDRSLAYVSPSENATPTRTPTHTHTHTRTLYTLKHRSQIDARTRPQKNL